MEEATRPGRRGLNERLRAYAGLAAGTDYVGTIERITGDVRLRGVNLWLLGCSAALASIGLDTNSAAVIIGAMLISPLMGPIVGIGLAVGINDRPLLVAGLRSFGVAMMISLVVATAYFLLTPLGDVTRELEARTVPTLLDVGVAFFGGLAGIVSGSRRERTNAIPGVAIATALMPPLCTAGFGLATGNPRFFFGAFYLFFLNAVFISVATLFVVRGLDFPLRDYADLAKQRAMTRWIAAFAILVTVPSVWLLLGLVQQVRLQKRVGRMLEQELSGAERDLFRWEFVAGDSARVLKVYVAGEPLTDAGEDSLRAVIAADPLVRGMEVRVVQTQLSRAEREAMTEEAAEAALRALDARPAPAPAPTARNPFAPGPLDTAAVRQVRSEILALFGEVEDVQLGATSGTTGASTQPSAIVRFRRGTRAAQQRRVLAQLEAFLGTRTGRDSVRVATP
jgi:uncharacterized hydrophobic protein (TIGR00271 family)